MSARPACYALYAAILCSGMGLIDGSATNVVLPILQRELHADATSLQWVVLGYTLFLSSLLLMGGALGDRYGRRRLLMIGLLIFTVASIVCALAGTPPILVTARCLQGIGGALMVPESLALISAAYAQSARGGAIGTWSATSALAAALGPILGGWLAQTFSWRAIFLINVPLAAVALALLWFGVDESRGPRARHLDFAGAASATAALGALTWGLARIPVLGAGAFALAAIASGVLLLAAFVAIEYRSPQPMVPMQLFHSREFAIGNAYTLLLYAALGGVFFFVPFDLINVRGYAPAAVGAAMLPVIAIMASFSSASGKLGERIGHRLPMVAGAIVAGAGFAIIGISDPHASYWRGLFPGFVVAGAGMAMFVAPLTTAVMNSVQAQFVGAASGINNAVSRAAGLFAVAGGSILIASLAARSFAGTAPRSAFVTGAFNQRADPHSVLLLHAAYSHAFTQVMIAFALCCLAAGILALGLKRGAPSSLL